MTTANETSPLQSQTTFSNGQPVSRVVDLLDASNNDIRNMSLEQARALVANGDSDAVDSIDGHFALVATQRTTVRMARTISRLMRYFIAKLQDGPVLVVADRIDAIAQWLASQRLADQFHPSYTRMVPAHYVVEIRLVGCPDPNPIYHRFFTPQRNTLPPDPDAIGQAYIRAVHDEIVKMLQRIPTSEPIGVCFSGGIDSGSVFMLTEHALRTRNLNPARLKAFTLVVDGDSEDLRQSRAFLEAIDGAFYLEPIEITADDVSVCDAIRVTEDYKPLDVQAAAVNLALLRGIRRRYPEWRYLFDGDGGDENLKDYDIAEIPELTIRSVLNNPLLYHEGWGVDSIKHSLTYSGGQSRGYARCYAPAAQCGFTTASPYTAPAVIRVAEAIPFIELTDWDTKRLYELKGEIVAGGVRAITGRTMPVFAKRRFQNGAMPTRTFDRLFAQSPDEYRRMFNTIHEQARA